MLGSFCCCGGYSCYSLTASQKRSLMRCTEWIQLRFRKIPLSTQSTGHRMLCNVLVSILAHPPMQLHGNYSCNYTQAWHIWDIDISSSFYSSNKPTETLSNIRKQHRPTTCNTVRRLHDDHVDLAPAKHTSPSDYLFKIAVNVVGKRWSHFNYVRWRQVRMFYKLNRLWEGTVNTKKYGNLKLAKKQC